MKFTFKKEPHPSGLAGVCFKNHTDIKYNKKVVGNILEVAHDRFTIWLKIVKADIMEDGNPNCTWRNAKLKKEFSSEDYAREWLNDSIEAIMKKYTLHI